MTAPPTQIPLFAYSEAHRLDAATAGTTSYVPSELDSENPWTSMASLQRSDSPPVRSPENRQHLYQPRQTRGPSTSPPSNERHAKPLHGLLFITGSTPDEFRSRKNMTKVRKKAMGSYLEKGKMPREEISEAQRAPREDLTSSRSSFRIEESPSNSEALVMYKDESRRPSARATTPTDSTYQQTDVTPAPLSTMLGMSMNFKLPGPPMILPMRSHLALPYDHYTPRPFESIGKPLDPFRSMFQASHPKVSVEELKWYCSRSFGTKAMGLHWIATLVKSPHAFLSTLCIASAHYDAIHERPIESVQTLALRQEVMHLISQSMVNPQSRVDDYNIIALTQLIVSELISGQEAALNYHELGIGAMIKQRGGLEKLDANGRIASTICWVSLESAVLRETSPCATYTTYRAPASSKTHPSHAPVPESPLYCPRGDFDTVKKSTRCSPRTLNLLKDIRMLIDLFLHETERSRQNALSLRNIHKKLATQYVPAMEVKKTGVMTPNEWRYEAVRIASIITATAITQRVPLSEALTHAAEAESKNITASDDLLWSPSSSFRHDSPTSSESSSPLYTTTSVQSNPFTFTPATPITPSAHFSTLPSASTALLKHLKHALESSDLSNCWADMAGVLMWLALTVATASRTSDKVLRKWFRALAARVSIVLCFEHPEAVHRGLSKLGEVVAALAFKETDKKGVGAGVGKRRRV